MVKALLYKIKETYKQFFGIINYIAGAKITKAENVKIRRSNIFVDDKSEINIGKNVTIEGYEINVRGGSLSIGDNTIMKSANGKASITINSGQAKIGNNNVIRSNIWVRFGGNLLIGAYNSINQGTMIRCDESVLIGDYNMISYECLIFDTNTHEFLLVSERRSRTKKDFPQIGIELRKPKTAAVQIGSDVWIGQRSIILKGSIMRNGSIAGTGAVISKKTVPEDHIAYGNPAIITKRK